MSSPIRSTVASITYKTVEHGTCFNYFNFDFSSLKHLAGRQKALKLFLILLAQNSVLASAEWRLYKFLHLSIIIILFYI